MRATEPQKRILKAILKLEKSNGNVIARDICEKYKDVNHSPLSIMLKTIEREKFIVRAVVPRGAKRWIKLTEKGLRECI